MLSKTSKGTPKLAVKPGANPGIPPERQLDAAHREDPYRLILEELYRKRKEIDAAIAAIEQVAAPTQSEAIEFTPRLSARPEEPHQPISAALLSVMRDLGGSARNGDIKAALRRSGYRFRGDPTVSVAQCLVRLAQAGLVAKLERGVWKLLPGADKARV